jgi:rod shape determining protein RodA
MRAPNTIFSIWPLISIALILSVIGLITIYPFDGSFSLAKRQIFFIGIGIVVYGFFTTIDMRFIRRTPVIIMAYGATCLALALLLIIGKSTMGAKSWFNLGLIAFQPADFAKLALITLLAKYFSRRHMEIGYIRHIIVSGFYAAGIIILVLVQPDLGTAVVLSSIWLGMILVSGISKKHLAGIAFLGMVGAILLWSFGLHEYQKKRIMTFIHPLSDIRGSGYNAYQATIAAGSGQLFGKGIGYGTQSKLQFLPEYETDFIFAAFAEEWGFFGIILVLLLYALLIFELVRIARLSETNFDSLFTLGVAILLLSHIAIHAGINLGLLPVTGTTIPFMSSGGSHVVMEFMALGIVSSLSRNGRGVPRELSQQEYEG